MRLQTNCQKLHRIRDAFASQQWAALSLRWAVACLEKPTVAPRTKQELKFDIPSREARRWRREDASGGLVGAVPLQSRIAPCQHPANDLVPRRQCGRIAIVSRSKLDTAKYAAARQDPRLRAWIRSGILWHRVVSRRRKGFQQ